jgi:hypothetical protein
MWRRKKPLLLTLKIDRRDNSAVVKSPSKSPDKSPSKSPKQEGKRKHAYSPERSTKKARSPKGSINSSDQMVADIEKKTIIIKYGGSQSQSQQQLQPITVPSHPHPSPAPAQAMVMLPSLQCMSGEREREREREPVDEKPDLRGVDGKPVHYSITFSH